MALKRTDLDQAPDEARLIHEDAYIRQAVAPGEHVPLHILLPQHLVHKIFDYAERHHEDVSYVIEQAMARALREQKL